jgi:hypothetical protein
MRPWGTTENHPRQARVVRRSRPPDGLNGGGETLFRPPTMLFPRLFTHLRELLRFWR